MAARIYVLGPADGSIAFDIQTFDRVDDDSLFLSSSDFELAARRRVTRLVRNKGKVRLAVYQQVFEKNMTRLGHVFGVVLELPEYGVSGTTALATLEKVHALVEQGCCTDGHFCGIEQFASFLRTEVVPVSSNILSEILGGRRASALITSSFDTELHQFWTRVGSDIPSELGPFADWFMFDPASVRCSSLYLAHQDSGIPGSLLRELQEVTTVAAASLTTLYSTAVSQKRSIEALTAKLNTAEQAIAEERKGRVAAEAALSAQQASAKAIISEFAQLQIRLHSLLNHGGLSAPVSNGESAWRGRGEQSPKPFHASPAVAPLPPPPPHLGIRAVPAQPRATQPPAPMWQPHPVSSRSHSSEVYARRGESSAGWWSALYYGLLATGAVALVLLVYFAYGYFQGRT